MLNRFKQKSFLVLFIIITLGIILRLYKFDNPIADWHSWRQSDTSSVTREFTKQGLNILEPKYQDLSNVPSGINNPNGYRFVEFPIYNIKQYSVYKVFPMLSLEQAGRVVTIFSSSLITLFLFLIIRRHSSNRLGLIISGVYTFLPFSIFYGRAILPDTSMIASVMASIYFFESWIMGGKKNKWNLVFYILSILFAAIAILLKPFALFFLLPIVYLSFSQFKMRIFINLRIWIFAILMIIPFILWRVHLQNYPEGVPASLWLLNGGGIRFTGAYFYWIFADRIGRLILGYSGYFLLLLGLLSVGKIIKEQKVVYIYTFFISSLLYLIIIARGNVQHDYYQIPIIPTISIFVGIGIYFIHKSAGSLFNKYISYLILGVSMVFMFMFSWYFVRDYYNINNPDLITVGRIADQILPQDAKVIAPYGGDTSFLYQINRSGWASLQNDLELMIGLGATHLVLINPTDQDRIGWGREYRLLSSGDKYMILELKKSP